MPDPTPSTDAPPPHPHEVRIGSLEQRVGNHDALISTLSATVERNEAANQKSRDDLTSTVHVLSADFATMKADQKDMPGLLRRLYEAVVGSTEHGGLAEDVRGLKASGRARGRTWDAVFGAILTLGAMLGASLLYLLIAGHAAKP